MIKKPVTIQTNMDMETRPIAHLVQEASQYSSSVYIELDEKKINAKSIMGMMSLNLTKGTNLVVVADGEDESNAVEGVEAFLAVGDYISIIENCGKGHEDALFLLRKSCLSERRGGGKERIWNEKAVVYI